MDKEEKFCEVFNKKVKDFDESCFCSANFAGMETLDANLHKLLSKENFSLPQEVLDELSELEMADLYDFKKELWKT